MRLWRQDDDGDDVLAWMHDDEMPTAGKTTTGVGACTLPHFSST
jgi:hypothetical protein